MVLSPVISDEQHGQHLLSMVHSDTAKPETLQPNEQVLTPRRARHPISSPVAGELVGARSDIRPPRRGALEYRVLTHQSLLQPSLSPRPAALIRSPGVTIQVAGMGGCQGFPVIASRRAVRTSWPCLRTVEMYPRTRSQACAPVVAR